MYSSESNGQKQLQDSRSREIRKCVRNYKKEMKSLEYSRLRSLVPSTASRPRVSKVWNCKTHHRIAVCKSLKNSKGQLYVFCVFQIEVIEEAIKYIAYLQATLSSRFDEPSESKLEKKCSGTWPGRIAHILNLGNFFSVGNNSEGAVEQTESESRPKIVRQKRQRLASYMIKTQRHNLPARRKFSSKSAEICVFLFTV